MGRKRHLTVRVVVAIVGAFFVALVVTFIGETVAALAVTLPANAAPGIGLFIWVLTSIGLINEWALNVQEPERHEVDQELLERIVQQEIARGYCREDAEKLARSEEPAIRFLEEGGMTREKAEWTVFHPGRAKQGEMVAYQIKTEQ
jgi:hypothetical protein